jgi:hypothetical protein
VLPVDSCVLAFEIRRINCRRVPFLHGALPCARIRRIYFVVSRRNKFNQKNVCLRSERAAETAATRDI